MIYAFRESSNLATPDLMKEIFSLRHRIFVDTLNWQNLDRHDNLERDEFDHSDAIHLALIRDGNVLAYSRLLPTLRPHLLSDVYPELIQGRDLPRGDDIWEWTRLCAQPGMAIGHTAPIRMMMVAVAEISVILRATRLIAQSDPGWIKRLNRLGWDARPMMVPTIYAGLPVVPLEARASAQTVEKSRRRLSVYDCVLDVSGLPEVSMAA